MSREHNISSQKQLHKLPPSFLFIFHFSGNEKRNIFRNNKKQNRCTLMIRFRFSDSAAKKRTQRRRDFSPYQSERFTEMLRRRLYLSLNPMTRIVFSEPYFKSSLQLIRKICDLISCSF